MSFAVRKPSLSKRSKSKSNNDRYTADDLPSLRRKRTMAFNRLTKAHQIGLSALEDDLHSELFLSYYQEIKKMSSSFEDAHLTILEIVEGSQEDEEVGERFDDMYFEVIRIHRSLTKSEAIPTNSDIQPTSSSHLKLPKITLPTFSGNIKEWPEFISTYDALIHNVQFDPAEKFQYMLSVLKGDALALVRTFPTTGKYYLDAYQALIGRYESKRDLAFTCWRDILNTNFKHCNALDLRRSLDAFDENLTILERLKLPVSQWDFVLSYHILSKLDPKLRREFEERHTEIELPSYQILRAFLHSKCEALIRDNHFAELAPTASQNRAPAVNPSSRNTLNSFKPRMNHVLVASHDMGDSPPLANNSSNRSQPAPRCSYCSNEHSILACEQFTNKPIEERMDIANAKQWCFNCLKSSHQIKDCKSIFSCQKCKHRHHTLLHKDRDTAKDSTNDVNVALVARHGRERPASGNSNSTVLLATAIVHVKDSSGNSQSFRAIFDTGSQNNFITEQAVRRLRLLPKPTSLSINGIGGSETSITGVVRCDVGNHGSSFFALDMYVLSKICGDQPIAKLNTKGWAHVKSLPLADPGFDIPGPIDILFGADVFAESLLNERIKGDGTQPPALNSIFGWLLLGKTSFVAHTSLLGTGGANETEFLSVLVQRFWELDNIPQASSLTPEERLCEEKFTTDHYRDESGRYGVRLPFKNDCEPFFEGSRDIALRRFRAIEKRLQRDSSLRSQYTDFMADYLESGHMTRLPAQDLGLGRYYLPHHCVLRPDSTTTKLRIVFDASARDIYSKSLNDSLLVGPKLENDVTTILLHFREHKVVFMSDVRQMYRQILVAPEHRCYQRILWRPNPDLPLQEYVLNTVTYGTSAASFLACRTMQQLAHDEGSAYPIAKQIVLSDLYVDDVVSGCDSLSNALEAKSQIINLFKRGGFELRKWASNVPELLADVPSEHQLMGSASFEDIESSTLKVLGLRWDPLSDSFVFHVNPIEQQCTKRTILSELARIFDPLGFLSPITIRAKCLIQKLWVTGIAWDDQPPCDIVDSWHQYLQEMPTLKLIRVHRHIATETPTTYELHGFCDSSELAYGAVIYIRVTDQSGSVQTFLHCSKARVAPIKRVSLPRLELCAAVLLADLIVMVKNALRIPLNETWLWSDSTVVLSWLRSHSSRWATFVANRVGHIHEIVPTESWRYVPTVDNPADICSRGLSPSALVDNPLWWSGPMWLLQPSTSWPVNIIDNEPNEAAEVEKGIKTVLLNEASEPQPIALIEQLFERFSSLQKIQNVLAYVYRFVQGARDRSTRPEDRVITDVERQKMLNVIVKFYQARHFNEETERLRNGHALSKHFRKLNPFLDTDGILRVGGRIARSGLEFEHKHPALLPGECPLTSRYIEFVHSKHCHPGVNTTQFLVMQQFWIIASKRVIRRYLSKCVKCYKTRPQSLQPFMSDMPWYRVNQAKAFSVVGVDFGGPFRIRLGNYRGAKIDKAYLCLFVCFATKAVHLEVVSSLSSDAFIASLRRFISRRGRCNVIHADCGTNFVGANHILSQSMSQAAEGERIAFRFNPPASPHFGGVWEVQIKAAKIHLYRVIGNQVLTFEELTTLFSQVEAVLNSRPLCPLSSDPNDLSVLTPGHFLTLEPLTAVPEEDLTDKNLRRLNRWQMLQAFHQHFWLRWKNEYLNTLTQRAKWTKETEPLKLNSLVIVKDDNRVPLQWSVGRVVELHASPDGVVRVASIRMANTHILKRPLVKLCPLPNNE